MKTAREINIACRSQSLTTHQERIINEALLDTFKATMAYAAQAAEHLQISTEEHYGVAESVGADKVRRYLLSASNVTELPKDL